MRRVRDLLSKMDEGVVLDTHESDEAVRHILKDIELEMEGWGCLIYLSKRKKSVLEIIIDSKTIKTNHKHRL